MASFSCPLNLAFNKLKMLIKKREREKAPGKLQIAIHIEDLFLEDRMTLKKR